MGTQKSLQNTPLREPLFFRSYSRPNAEGKYESFNDLANRVLLGFAEIGKLEPDEIALIREQLLENHSFPSGRFLWCGGTEWSKKQENFYGMYNCSGTKLETIEVFSYLMLLAMQGCGTGVSLESKFINKLPIIKNKLNVTVLGKPGEISKEYRLENTEVSIFGNKVYITVGDSKEGWVNSYYQLIKLATDKTLNYELLNIEVLLHSVRAEGEFLRGFGGVANPNKLPYLFEKVADILNGANGRQLTPEECCLLIDEAALVVVSGSIRRSAGIRQFDKEYGLLKLNLWKQTEDGTWSIDGKKDALRMANHTRVYHSKPSLEECIEAVRMQYESGEGAIQYAPEAIARANADIFDNDYKKQMFLREYGISQDFHPQIKEQFDNEELEHRLTRYLLNPCGEIISSNFLCNLSEVHLNTLEPLDIESQRKAFKAGAISVAALLHHEFYHPIYRYSRELDPIVGVSITGLFDFFVNLFGIDWLTWWEQGRPDVYIEGINDRDKVILSKLDIYKEWMDGISRDTYSNINKTVFFRIVEKKLLTMWKQIVFDEVKRYCNKHNLKVPNRCTTVQPAGSKSLLTNASPGWHPPKAINYIRRITYRKNDPGAKACMDMGYKVVPSQSDKDKQGNLLNDPFDERCTEWLVEIPVSVNWFHIQGVENIDPSKFSVMAQFDFYMQVQKHYTTHNTSGTLEIREDEIEALGTAIYKAIANDEGYISSAILARFDDKETYPRLPFEPISKETYEKLVGEVKLFKTVHYLSFQQSLEKYSRELIGEVAPAGCDSDACLNESLRHP